jgi:serine/threonine protein kinase
MVMEYAGGGDLLQFVKQRKRLEELDAKYIFKQIVYGLGHCHCRSVLHRDIKLDNILMDLELQYSARFLAGSTPTTKQFLSNFM